MNKILNINKCPLLCKVEHIIIKNYLYNEYTSELLFKLLRDELYEKVMGQANDSQFRNEIQTFITRFNFYISDTMIFCGIEEYKLYKINFDLHGINIDYIE